MDNHSMNQAIEVLLNNFTKHPVLASNTENNAFEILKEFWRIKSLNSHLNESSDSSLISYEFLENYRHRMFAFVLCQTGCFAIFQNAMTKTEAWKNAALISVSLAIHFKFILQTIN